MKLSSSATAIEEQNDSIINNHALRRRVSREGDIARDQYRRELARGSLYPPLMGQGIVF